MRYEIAFFFIFLDCHVCWCGFLHLACFPRRRKIVILFGLLLLQRFSVDEKERCKARALSPWWWSPKRDFHNRAVPSSCTLMLCAHKILTSEYVHSTCDARSIQVNWEEVWGHVLCVCVCVCAWSIPVDNVFIEITFCRIFNFIVWFECRSAVRWRKWRSSKYHSVYCVVCCVCAPSKASSRP